MYKRSEDKTDVVKIWVTGRWKGNKLQLTGVAGKMWYILIIIINY